MFLILFLQWDILFLELVSAIKSISFGSAADKIEKNKIQQNRWFFVFLAWLGIGKKGNAVGFGQNRSLIC